MTAHHSPFTLLLWKLIFRFWAVITLLPLFCLFHCAAFGQQPAGTWEWALSMPGGFSDNSVQKHLSVDCQGDVYTGYRFMERFAVGDTVFEYDSATDCFALVKTGRDGHFIRACEIHGKALLVPQFNLSFTVTGNQDVYLAGTFWGELYIGDTVIHPVNGISSGKPDVFLVRLNPDLSPAWTKVTGSSGYDYFHFIEKGPADNLMMGASYQLLDDNVRNSGEEPDTRPGSPLTSGIRISNLSPDGTPVWEKELTSVSGHAIGHTQIKLAANGNICLWGDAAGSIMIDGQLLQHPEGPLENYYISFVALFDPDGNILNSGFFDQKVYLLDLDMSGNNSFQTLSIMGDTTVMGPDTIFLPQSWMGYIIATYDQELQPVWYKTIEMPEKVNYFPVYTLDHLLNLNDTINFAVNCLNSFIIDSTWVPIGNYPQGCFGRIASDGRLLDFQVTKSTQGATIYDLEADPCGNLIFGGEYHQSAFFGNDTLLQTNPGDDGERYFARLARFERPVFTLGKDTTIHTGQSLNLSLPVGYPYRIWSTGDTTREITLQGSDLGIGKHTIWAEAGKNSCCASRDSVTVEVTQNYSSGPFSETIVKPWPNPTRDLVSLPVGNPVRSILVSDIFGKPLGNMRSTCTAGILTLDLSGTPPGFYFISVATSDKTFVYKVAKQ